MPEMSEARKRANKKWNDENLATRYDHIHLALPVGYKDKLKAAAEMERKQEGRSEDERVSVNDFIRKAIDRRIDELEARS